MILFPAVDIKDGSAVRLKQGQADKKGGGGVRGRRPRAGPAARQGRLSSLPNAAAPLGFILFLGRLIIQ